MNFDLRSAVLQAAIQGNLTDQRPEDGTAEELLEQIRAEKKKLIIEGKIKREKALPPITEEDIPFDIPKNWVWVRFNKIFNFIDYRGMTPIKSTRGIFLITASNIRKGFMDYTRKEYISDEEYQKRLGRGITKKGDLLFTTEAPMGNTCICELEKCSCGQRIITFKPYATNTAVPKLFMYFILSAFFQKQLLDDCTGTTAKGIKAEKLKRFLIPLPPLAEQERIVERVEALMSKIDAFEEADNKLEELKKKFPEDLRDALLQAAIQGKLTEQRSEDGTAEELLEQIRAEKKKLIAEGKIQREKALPPITEDEKPFDIPDNWCWVRLGEIGNYKKGPFGSSLTKSIFVSDGKASIKVYEQKNAIKKDWQLGEYFITKEYYDERMKGFTVTPGDIIVSCAGTIGETYILPKECRIGIINQALMRISVFSSINKDFYLTCFNHIIKNMAQLQSQGTALKNIPPFSILKNMIILLPPLAEQERIVERLNELLPLCERMKQ